MIFPTDISPLKMVFTPDSLSIISQLIVQAWGLSLLYS